MVLVLEASLNMTKELLAKDRYLTVLDNAVKYTESVSLIQNLLVTTKFPIVKLLSV